ncbi:hypothetical protein OIU91_41465 (plasmid) [Streptomyces sp. NBC_01456]|uniref:hypothetical protein n=1 Tax=unclassified Streptomyces TaxID=2593676 RepID=UPI002E35F369|nr:MULTISPECIES: hypothetical protein [unclassified Streptomyces]
MTHCDPATTAALDQLSAAHRTVKDLAVRAMGPGHSGPLADLPAWFQKALLDAYTTPGFTAGPCTHLAAGRGPQPVMVWAETPTRARCAPCNERDQHRRTCAECERSGSDNFRDWTLRGAEIGIGILFTALRCPDCAEGRGSTR